MASIVKVGAQPYFNRISTDDGLSCNVVHDICQDSHGFIWAATSYGLGRYDGFKFDSYYKEDLDIYSNFIISLCPDDAGNIWIGTDKGVTVYNINDDRFTNFNTIGSVDIHNKVPLIQKDDKGFMWVVVNRQGVFRIDPRNAQSCNYFVENGVQTLPADISAMYIDSNSNQNLFGVYYDNLYITDSTLTELIPYRTADGTEPFAGGNIKSIVKSHQNSYYIAYSSNRICQINPVLKSYQQLPLAIGDKVIVKRIYLDRNDRLWIATNDGTWIYDTLTEKVDILRYWAIDDFSLPDNDILNIFEDRSGQMWVSTYGSGIGMCRYSANHIRKIYHTDDETLTGCRTRSFAEDDQGRVWVGTEQKGVFVYNLKDDTIEKYRSSLLPDNIMCMLLDGKQLWLSAKSGIFRLDISNGHVKRYLDDKDIFFKLYRNSRQKIIVGTTLGLLEYDSTSDSFVPVDSLKDLFIDDIIEDVDGNMWYATYAHGLYKCDAENRILAHYVNDPADSLSLPGDKVMSVFEDSRGTIWATPHGTGICRLTDNGQFVVFDKSCGLSNNIVYTIIEDNAGKLWIATDNGLTELNPVTCKAKVYNLSNGLLNNDFNYGADIKTRSGDILLGSRDGFIRFNSDSFVNDSIAPQIKITSLSINNHVVKPHQKGSPLDKSIALTRRIELSARQNTVTFALSILDFNYSDNTALYYRLDNYNDEWQKVGADHLISFTRLPAGHYVLRVEGMGSNEVWNRSVPPIELIVNPKLPYTTAAFIVYGLLFLLLIYYLVRFLNRRYARKQDEKRKWLEQQQQIELYNDKISFFSNIAHEIKTPLMLIKMPLDNILNNEEMGESVKEDLSLIDQNTQYLMQLIGELLDFTKIERQGYRLSCTRMDLVEFIDFLSTNFQMAINDRRLTFRFVHEVDHIYICADKAGCAKIVNNLFSNALKYAGSYITVTARVDGVNAVVEFCNDGPIVPLEQRNKIFDIFAQYRDKDQKYANGFGIGLTVARTMAELHSGSLTIDDDTTCNNFILTLPLAVDLDPAASTETPTDSHDGVDDDTADADDSTKRSTVLLVEDNTSLSNYLYRELSKSYKVYQAPNGKRAIDIAYKKVNIDVIVSDIAMPEMDGIEMCHILKSDFRFSHIPIIILSAHMSNQMKVACMEEGADIYIEKPFAFEYLVSCIDNLIGKRQMFVQSILRTELAPTDAEQAPDSSPYDALSPLDAKFIESLDKAVAENLPNYNYSVKQLSEDLCLSKSTLNRKMKGVLNLTPNDYIRIKRLIMASEMILKGDKKIKEIGYSVGFQTPSYFIKCFKSHFGILPSEYAAQIKNNKR